MSTSACSMVLSLGSACTSSTDGLAPQQEDLEAECLPEQHLQRLIWYFVSPVARLHAWLGTSARWSLPSVHLLLAKAVLLLLLKALAQPHHWGFSLSQEASCLIPATRSQPLLPPRSDSCSFCSAHCSICIGNTRSVTGLPFVDSRTKDRRSTLGSDRQQLDSRLMMSA